MRSDPRVGAISPADVVHVWVVRSVRRGAKLWLRAVPGPWPCPPVPSRCPNPDRERVRWQFGRRQHASTQRRRASCCTQVAAQVAQQSAEAAGTPEDLNDSIWTIGPTRAIRHGTALAARHGLGCTFLLIFTTTSARTHRRPGMANHCRIVRPFFSGLSDACRPNAPSLFPIQATWKLVHSDRRPIYKLWRLCARACACAQSGPCLPRSWASSIPTWPLVLARPSSV